MTPRLLRWCAIASLAIALPALADPTAPTASPEPAPPTAEAVAADAKLYTCATQTGQIAVTLRPDTELKDLLAWAMGFTCKNFIYDPKIVSGGKKISVMTPNKMTPAEAYQLFLLALSSMNLTVVPKGNALRIVDAPTSRGESLPIYQHGLPGDNEEVVRYVLRPTYAQTETLRAALDAMKSQAGTVAVADTMLLITDFSSNVRDMLTIARAIDVPGNSDGVYTVPVRHADAAQLQQKLSELLGLGTASKTAPAPGGKPGAPPTTTAVADNPDSAIPSKILVDERTNTLILLAHEAGYQRVLSLVQRLDIATDTEGGVTYHVYNLENAAAEDLALLLNNAQSQGQVGKTPTTAPGTAGAKPAAAITPPAVPTGDNNLGAAVSGQIKVIGDKATNSLVVMATARDYLSFKEVIKRLDHKRRQVYIEATIMNINLDKGSRLGASEHTTVPVGSSSVGIVGSEAPQLSSLSPASSLAAAATQFGGLLGGLIGGPLANTTLGSDFPASAVVFQALATEDNSDIVTSQRMMALDNELTKFSIGDSVPYQSGVNYGGLGTGSGSASSPLGSIGQNIQRAELTLELDITPHISSDDLVRLEIKHTNKDIKSGLDSAIGPTWTVRELDEQVVVNDQQSIMLGGQIQESATYSTSKVPILGDIPLLGKLFSYTTKDKTRSNLLIVLTPYIIKDPADLDAILKRNERERDEFVRAFRTLDERNYMPTADYRRKRGLIEDINRAVLARDEEIAARAALGDHQYVPGGLVTSPSPSP